MGASGLARKLKTEYRRTPVTPIKMIAERPSMIQKRSEIIFISPDFGSTGAHGGPGFHDGRGGAASTVCGHSATTTNAAAMPISTRRRGLPRLEPFRNTERIPTPILRGCFPLRAG